MAQDDFQAELKRRRQQPSQQPSDDFQAELKRRRLAESAQPTVTPSIDEEPTEPMGRGLARSIGQGLPFVGTFADEAEAFARAGFDPNRYGEEKEKINEEMARFRKQSPYAAYGAEIGTGLLTGGIGTKLLQKGGTMALSKALQSAAIQGGLAGAGAAEGGVGERLAGGATGAAVGGLLGRVLTPGSKVTQRDLGRDIAAATAGLGQNVRIGAAESLFQRAARGTTELQRKASDALTPRGGALGFLGNVLEPTDAIKIQRAAAAELPSGMTAGVVAESAKRASQAAKGVRSALKTAEETAQTATERAGARASRVLSIGKGQAKRDAQQVLDNAEAQARELIGDVRGGTPNTSAIQDAVRSFQLAEGRTSYDLVRKIGRPPEPDPEVYREMLRDPALRNAYQSAADIIREEAQDLAPGMAIREGLPSIRIDGGQFPELSLEMFDQIRRKIMEPAARTAEGTTGLSLQAKRAAMKQINRLEDRFLAGYGKDEAAMAIKNARTQYRARFEQLEALQDGLSIGMAKAGKAAKVVGKNRMELDEFVRRAEAYQGASKEMFKAGAAKWFDNLVTEGLGDDAVKFLRNATKSEGALRRLRLAFDDETIAKMQQFANVPAAAEKAGAATTARAAGIVERVAARGQQQAAKATGEAEALAKQLAEQRGRAKELITTARAGRVLQNALGESTGAQRAQDTFVETMLGRLGTQGQRTMQEIAGSDIQRELAGLTVDEARKRIQSLQQNRAMQRLLSPQLAALERASQAGPRVARPTYARVAGRIAGGPSGNVLGKFLPFGEEEE